MKGVALRTIILLVVAVIVIAVALYFLVFVTNFDSLFLSNDQRILKQYATCALAYCAAGAGSDEVNAVGCLKYEGGRCTLSCAQVEKEVYLENDVAPTVTEIGGRGAPHYCGSDAKLEFEFSGVSLGGIVPLASGQMDKLANKPEWVCKPIKIPFVGVELDSIGIPTTDIQHGGILGAQQNCIILSGRVLFEGLGLPTTRDGCFQAIKYDKSHDSIYYTPIIEYDEPQQIIYPSAIYVDRSFTETIVGASQPECDFRNAPNHGKVSEEDITKSIKNIIGAPATIGGKPTGKTNQEYFEELGKIGEKDVCLDKSCKNNVTQEQKKLIDFLNANYLGDVSTNYNLMGNFLNRCNFKTTYGGEKIKYMVWAKPVYPTIDALKQASGAEGFENFIQKILGYISDDLRTAFGSTTSQIEDFTKLAFSQLGGSCTAVVLSRDLEINPIENTKEKTDQQETSVIKSLETDKMTYTAGETVKVSGAIENPSENTELEVEMKRVDIIGGVIIPVRPVLLDDGTFSFEYNIPEGVRGISSPARYKITATYGENEKEIEFTV